MNLAEHLKHPIFNSIQQLAQKQGVKVFVIGGFVRDLFLDKVSKDVDILIVGNGIAFSTELAKVLGKEKQHAVFKNFGTSMLKLDDFEVEFVGARKESYRADSRKPIVEDGTLEDDQNRRDFTINTLALGLNADNFGDLMDPFGGLEDLNNQIIRTPLAPDITYSDDPLRMMRAIRFASTLQFTIVPESIESIQKNAHRIKIVSMERISEELNKIILSKKPSIGFKLLFDSGLLKHIFPQMVDLFGVDIKYDRSHKDNFYHTLEVLDNVCQLSDDLWLRWAAILHDIAKPATKRWDDKAGWTFHGHEDKGARMVPAIFNQLKLPLNDKMKFVQKLVKLHLRPIVLAQEVVTDSAVRRLLFDAGEDIDALMMLCHADVTTKNEYKKKKYQRNFEHVKQKIIDVEERDNLRNWQPPVTGNDIMLLFNLTEGKTVGNLKNTIREAILEGEIKNNRQEAINFLKQKAAEIGLVPVGNIN